jgi:hypothetical protein
MPGCIALQNRATREDTMLTSILTVSCAALLIVLLIWRSTAGRPARREPVYVCDICNSQDCLCRKER